jgi:hypothetical protein
MENPEKLMIVVKSHRELKRKIEEAESEYKAKDGEVELNNWRVKVQRNEPRCCLK